MSRRAVKFLFYTSFGISLFLLSIYPVLSEAFIAVSAIFFSCASAILFLILMPPVRREVCRKRENCQLEGAEDGDVWLFISEGALYLPWYNIISKEIGPCRMINAIPELGQPRLIILPQGTSLKGIETEILLRWVEKGVALFCECPGEDLAGLTGLRYTGEKYHCHKEEFLGAVLDLSGASSLVYRPLREKNIAVAKPDFLFENRIGLGVVFTLNIEYCRWA
ncbi:MAG: hypothetical protein M0R66_09135, partial [Candidatus Omnitrophica bacterium]|nr:hypothetical protein [Candidatus Omnitrophota bacterium]